MQLISLERSQTTKLFWGLTFVFGLVSFLTTKQSDPTIVGAAVFLGMITVCPFYFWMLGWSRGLPIWPVFALMTGAAAALPMLQAAEPLANYSSGEVVAGAVATALFLVAGTVAWVWVSHGRKPAPKNILMIAREHSYLALLLFIFSAVLFHANEIARIVEYPGNTMPVVRSVTSSLASMGVFVLAYSMGRGALNNRTRLLFVLLTSIYILLCCTSLMLASAVTPVALAALGYTLGGEKLPWRMMLAAFFVISVLHAGKWEMRATYWSTADGAGGATAAQQVSLLRLPEFFSKWFTYGIEELGGLKGALEVNRADDDASSVFERAGMLHMLLLVQRKTPDEVPYLGGATYTPIPRLLIPRFLDDQKGISHVANVMLSLHYGLLTIDSINTTSIGWGVVAEAYANSGYIGVLAVGVLLGMFYAYVAKMSAGVPMTSLRFVIGLLILSGVTDAQSMSVFVTSQFQGVVAVTVAALFLMRRQPNPFAVEGRPVLPVWRQPLRGHPARASQAYAAKASTELSDGMPAPGLLTALIEGEAGRKAVEATAPAMNGDQGEAKLSPRPAHVLPRRVASWMPRRMREQVVAQQEAEKVKRLEDEESKRPKDKEAKRLKEEEGKPRQLAVPYQTYRRYRG